MCNLYILLCRDNSLYTGVAKDIEERLEVHNSGKGSKYVNSRKPFKLIYTECFESWSEALKREIEIKKWSREEKINRLKLNIGNLRNTPHIVRK
ncbi:MAG TPA: GIY-YIG nuclease family protein [Candidatus Dojkabacteria bacterium]|nr:GIY-YIG nuclease family protein [Candidatus Dojkabacteria bacterium]HRO64717.1 GIY-YIG nuclease family protein [Candidatus Dojkabacteria bacterium]HRP37361.1 GIY-YIG nuclease family protein [Candidatus Dojkabacteria bacterium]HRP51552.1 GIY-YIG nuclease family protein [Candidatus Dojkabacteria bacterium]